MKLTTSNRKRTAINLTALIDILFLLIIFFSVSTRFTNQQAIGIDLPKSETSTTISTSEKLVIILHDQDRLFINGQQIEWEAAEEELGKKRYDRSQKVILNIDKAITHGKVIRLLDLLKLHQYKTVVFGTYGKT
jgi:biopolymer transport protein ExbD